MKNKKKSSKRKEDSESSSSSSSSDSDGESSGSSSDSSRSPARKKSKSTSATHSKRRSSSSDNEPKSSKGKASKDVQEERLRIDRKEIEHSKWDSPVDRIDKKKKTERRDSESREKENKRDRERKDERYGDRQESSKDRDRRNDRGYSKRYDDRDNRGRNRDYRNDDRDRERNDRERSDRDRERNDRDRGDDDRDNRGRNRDYRNDDRDRERNDRDRDRRDERYQRGGDRKRSPQREQRNMRRNRSRSASFDHSKARWGREEPGQTDKKDVKPNSNTKEKEKPNFGLSGKLTEETNTYKGVVIKYSEPPEARKPRRRWRLYPFKGEKAMQTLYIHRESAYLIGRDRKVVDLPVDHPSCSKQHAALQYRLVPFTRDDGSVGKRVRPYLIDLDSANGTYINNKKIDPRKYVELLEKDVIKFGFSSREYVLLHENSKDEKMDDDVKIEEEEEVKRERED